MFRKHLIGFLHHDLYLDIYALDLFLGSSSQALNDSLKGLVDRVTLGYSPKVKKYDFIQSKNRVMT